MNNDIQTFDLDRNAWDEIKQAAKESKWMPPDYTMNDWVWDVCQFLRGEADSGHSTHDPQSSPSEADKRATAAPQQAKEGIL